MTDQFDDFPGPVDEPVARFVAELRLEADRSRFADLATPALTEPGVSRVMRRGPRQAVAAIVATVALVATFTGAAVAAQGAGPGDLLYPLDQALEVVGVGDGGTSERLDEARSLAEQESFDRGLRHAAETLSDHPEAQSALSAAAERVVELPPEDVGVEVASLLDYLEINMGSVDGQAVADLAQQIGTGKRQGGPPDDVPAGAPPADVPGSGRPADVPGRCSARGRTRWWSARGRTRWRSAELTRQGDPAPSV